MARLSRKEMKRDEVQEALGRAVVLLRLHQRTILMALGGLALVALALVGVTLYLSARGDRAHRALDEALKIYRAPVDEETADPEDPDDPSFPDEASRAAKAAEMLEAVRSDYGNSVAGDVADVYLAELAVKEGDLKRARELWTAFLEDHGDHILAASVRLNLISLDRQEGTTEELLASLRASLEEEEKTLPEDALLFELGRTLEEAGESEEARETFQRLVDDFPRSPYTLEARRFLADNATGGSLLPLGT